MKSGSRIREYSRILLIARTQMQCEIALRRRSAESCAPQAHILVAFGTERRCRIAVQSVE